MKIKTRFAPSPTGYLHLGSVRTALYSWLLARNTGGKFVLRIEDTDIARSTQSATEAIMAGMKWLNLTWDEGPYFQSKRLDRYHQVINTMLAHQMAYKCYCTKEQLSQLRATQIAAGEKPRYNGRCRNNKDYHKTNELSVIRFRNPPSGTVKFIDLIRGCIEFSNQELDDLIIRRTDGLPTYNFCAVVDDYDMAITHVIRGEEHINNTPRQINILKALGAPVPQYAHVSIILNNDGKKLSKRHSELGLMQYRNDGFLPEALLNYLVRLGWAHGDQEIFSIDEMQQLFSLDAVSKSANTFNMKKLLWLNHYYINHLSVTYIASHLLWHIQQQGIDISTGPQLEVLIPILAPRCKTLKEMATICRYFYHDIHHFDTAAEQYLQLSAVEPLQILYKKLAELTIWNESVIHEAIKQTAQQLGLPISKIAMPLRVALTGGHKSPGIDITVQLIGRLRCLSRITTALIFLTKKQEKISSVNSPEVPIR